MPATTIATGSGSFLMLFAISALLHGGVVNNFHWLNEQQFLDAVATAAATGAIAGAAFVLARRGVVTRWRVRACLGDKLIQSGSRITGKPSRGWGIGTASKRCLGSGPGARMR